MIHQVEEHMTFCFLSYYDIHRCTGPRLMNARAPMMPFVNAGITKITLISADKQPHIRFLHAAVDVILFVAERIDSKDVNGH